MSPLRIDETKIKETMERPSVLSFVVTGTESTAATPKLDTQKSVLTISGTVGTSTVPNNPESRAYLSWLFDKIDQSGTALKTEDELNTEIDEMRRRNW